MQILINTFKLATATVEEVGEFYAARINGKVDVEFGNKTFEVWAIKHESGNVSALGFIGRYKTGAKAWRASVQYIVKYDHTTCWFGRDDRASKFKKESGISYEPKTFFKV